MISHSSSLMKDMFTLENAVCLIIIALLLTIVIRKCKKNKENFMSQVPGSDAMGEAEEEEGGE